MLSSCAHIHAFCFVCINISRYFWPVNKSELRQSILLPETKAGMLCLNVHGRTKAHKLLNKTFDSTQ